MFILYLCLTIFLVPILIAMILVQIVQKISFCSGSQCLQQFILKRKCNITLLLETRNYISLLINSQYLSSPSSPPSKKNKAKQKMISSVFICSLRIFGGNLKPNLVTKLCIQFSNIMLCFQLKSLLACMIKVSFFFKCIYVREHC